ncbi:hypothetical protein NDU88_001221 [Pleurodeles waltl]|uniref:Uncharacterized protein n=1 Tax=Pleurodeles waltl TaxID=8319 RepID=A0AAV7VYS7_PLEWA|nr:hypothetical protein NDU88_001221 [Pleurodeles waltl]
MVLELLRVLALTVISLLPSSDGATDIHQAGEFPVSEYATGHIGWLESRLELELKLGPPVLPLVLWMVPLVL